jgi:hypothetical protein
MKKNACIMCGKEKDGLPVKEDWIIKSIRWVKHNITHSEKNYRLVVCKEDFLDYKKKRDSYERKQILYISIGIIFTVALTITARGALGAIGVGIIIIIFMFLLAQLSYMPGVDLPTLKKKPSKK